MAGTGFLFERGVFVSKCGEVVSDSGVKTLLLLSETIPATAADCGRVLYFFEGDELLVDGDPVSGGSGMVLQPDADIPLSAGPGGIECLLLQGRPIGEPVAQYGPFVMNTRAEIQQAFDDYQRTQFGGWPWDRDDPVHGSESKFART